MGKVIFKKAELDDLPELYSFGENYFLKENEYFEKWNPENIADIFMDDSALMIIAFRDKKILGAAVGKIFNTASRIMEIIWFGVLEKFLETRLTEDLLKALNNAARESGVSSIRIKVSSNNSKVFAADFNKTGFVETGIIRVLDLKL